MSKAADYANGAVTVATLALQIASTSVPIPGLDAVLNVMQTMNDACSNAKAQKDKFEDLKGDIERLRRPLVAHSKIMEKGPLMKSVDHNLRELEKIDIDLQQWSSYSWLQALLYSRTVSSGLQNHRDSLQKLIDQYDYQMVTLNATLAGDQTVLVKRLVDMQKQSFKGDEELFDENNNKLTRVEFEIRFRALQTQLKEMVNNTGRSAHPQISNAELEIPNPQTVVGSGLGTTVIQGFFLGETVVAVKRLDGLSLVNKYIQQFNNELKLWHDIKRHEHLLLFLGWHKVNDNFAFVSEWMDNGNIIQFCSRNRDADRLHLLAGAADGLNHLHHLNIGGPCVHGKLKGTNVMVNDKLEAMISDFQMAKTIKTMNSERGVHDSFTRSPSPRWSAPEFLRQTNIGPHCDVWSFGMLMIEVFTLQVPFVKFPNENTLHGVICQSEQRPERPMTDWVTDAVWEVMQGCWKEYDQRPSMDEVYKMVLEAEQHRKEHPPTEKFDHPQYDRFAHLNHRYGTFN
ncbi:kinase-like domain-containing protein [Irpex rosettiformis]|uniref:Kinase-like domain-containing protein n=1 Tax=Irpex rosettiformis TaxID=378272 RepID=A0ACB8UG25_9APHY|nr:kinase-like domain-containing protein [Irpex rosettiformis]